MFLLRDATIDSFTTGTQPRESPGALAPLRKSGHASICQTLSWSSYFFDNNPMILKQSQDASKKYADNKIICLLGKHAFPGS